MTSSHPPCGIPHDAVGRARLSTEAQARPLAFYNEIDSFAAQWLRELIAADLIAPGVVDERDIRDICPDDLAGYTQVHLFAGIGVWSYALRRAGWPDDRPVWTGSCPCQPFSAAGGRAGFADERHLWPAFHWLISQCRPVVVLGEQVASGAANDWLDLVQADVEGMDYAFGCVPLPAAGVGAPHIRDRAFWMAYAVCCGAEYASGRGVGKEATLDRSHRDISGERLRPRVQGAVSGLAHADGRDTSAERQQSGGQHGQLAGDGSASRLANANGEQRPGGQAGISDVHAARGRHESATAVAGLRDDLRPGATNGFWRDADWLCCTDGKWRPVEPGAFPLAHGAPARVGRLRGYGNAINAEVATAFIEAVIDTLSDSLNHQPRQFAERDRTAQAGLVNFHSQTTTQNNG